jgi:simple sugar transport system ATP-binding protein
MDIMRQLAKAGTSIIFITHKLREVKAVADRITVIRLGKVVGHASPSAKTSELASLMVGREIRNVDLGSVREIGPEVLGVNNISVLDDRNQRAVDHVSFSVHGGEILAIAGVQGNGQNELAEALMGLRPLIRGEGSIVVSGKNLTGASVRQVLDSGVGFIPEDRKKDGLVLDFSIAENFMLNQSFASRFTRGLSIDRVSREVIAQDLVERFDIRTPSIDTRAGNLSGGNQQKVVVARELSREISLLIASQPTRGVDVGAIEFIHGQLLAERDKGTAILLISSELDEVLAIADRIAVMYRGKIVGIVNRDTSRETLGQMMAGVKA